MSAATIDRYRLGPLGAIPPGEGRNFRVEGLDVAVFRTRSGEVFATQASCPHRGAPLADSLVGGERIVCPFHSFAFSLRTGEAIMNACPALLTYPVSIDGDGEIYLSLAEA